MIVTRTHNGQTSGFRQRQNGRKPVVGPDGRIYPWGNIFVSEESASAETLPESSEILTAHLTPIGVRPAIVSPYGLGEAVGNVWEWTADWYQSYPERKNKKKRAAIWTINTKPLRGGSWLEVRDGTAERYFRCVPIVYTRLQTTLLETSDSVVCGRHRRGKLSRCMFP